MTKSKTPLSNRQPDAEKARRTDPTQGGPARRGIETGVPGPEEGLNSINRALEEIIDNNADEGVRKKRD